MLERLYISLIGIYFIALALFYAGGMLNAKAGVVFGFILFGLIYMGIISVLPNWRSHQSHLKH